jgi:hypothetical protein
LGGKVKGFLHRKPQKLKGMFGRSVYFFKANPKEKKYLKHISTDLSGFPQPDKIY